MTACNLDIPVEDKITGEDAIDNIVVANEALSGIYGSYPLEFIKFSVLADDFYPNRWLKDDFLLDNFYKWEAPIEVSLFSDNYWVAYYKMVSRVNALQKSYSHIKTKDKKERETLTYIKAQALCLKALAYFDLVKMYAPTYSASNKMRSVSF